MRLTDLARPAWVAPHLREHRTLRPQFRKWHELTVCCAARDRQLSGANLTCPSYCVDGEF